MPSPSGPVASIRRSRKSIAAIPSSSSTFDKENSTIQDIGNTGPSSKTASKKSRSKSIGPGGLEALNETAGNAQKALVIPRSILKPTIPLSPPKPIPPHPSTRRGSPGKGKLISSPRRQSPGKRDQSARQSGQDNLPNPFEDAPKHTDTDNAPARVSVKSEEEQQEAARQREKKEAIERRDARRKSLANRRVSFAPEATLHTWDVVELAEDATSSSEATNSTRRASSASSLPASPFPQHTGESSSDPSDPPSTPPHEEIQVAASPAHQRDLHQKKRRRSSGIPPMNFNNPDDFSSSPMSTVSSDDGSFITAEEEEIIDASDSDSDKDIVEREETITNIDEATSQSVMSPDLHSTPSNNTSQRLDEALRQAAEHAGSQKTTEDDDGDVSMEMATGEITYAFKPWVNKEAQKPNLARGLSSQQDQENVNPFAPSSAREPEAAEDEDAEMTMEVTQAVGGILPPANDRQSPKKRRRKSIVGNRRRSSMARRRSSVHPDNEDETMELTTAVGGIQPEESPEKDQTSSLDGDEEMSMEFTSVVGGVINRGIEGSNVRNDDELAQQQLHFEQDRRASITSDADGEGMDMTVAMGGILSPVTERTEPSEENTDVMDFTAAVGAILPKDLKADDKSEAKALMEEEADHGQLTKSPFMRQSSQDMLELTTPTQKSVKTSETGSPAIVGAQTRSGRRSAGGRQSATPRSESRQTTPLKKPTTPSKQLTPQPERPTTPSKTPPAKNVVMRRASPKKLFKEQIKKQATPDKQGQPTLKFNEDATTGVSVPSVVLTPRSRRPSGVGIDQGGMGSPRAAALLDRRTSIGDQAATFTPQGPAAGAVRFADPRELEQEIDNERAEDERRESGRNIMEREADGLQEDDKDVTANLRGMIDSMTPRKNKLKGRKSLAVGAAKGLLGKRPAELDEEDEDATPKRLRGMDRSPVKSVRLPAPPSKDETTGRLGKAPRFSLALTSGNVVTPTTQSASPEKANTPRDQGRFKDTEAVKSASKPPVSFNEQLAGAPAEPEPQEADDDRIHLQDFLNMTSIRFMELTTTKRRHTIAPNKAAEDDTLNFGEQPKEGDDRRLSACVVAGASTIPMLELYQHSCRELKKYISEGRSIVREIETDTYEENPPLFREYMTAPPAVRSIMDNQFKNIKTHARLNSKAMWYEWRMKLLEGLKAGLLNIGNSLVEDSDILSKQEQILESVLPSLIQQHEHLSSETATLQAEVDALTNCDQDELRQTRETLIATEAEISSKKAQIASLQSDLAQQESSIETSTTRKATCLSEIASAEKVREECRGWTSAEVSALKANVDALQKSTGWTIASAHENTLTFAYRGELELYLTPSAFAPHAEPKSSNAAISLSYTPAGDKAPGTTHRFFLQLLRARLLAVPQPQTQLRQVLSLVSNGWDLCGQLIAQIDALTAAYPSETSIVSDETLRVSATVLLREMRTKVDVGFDISVCGLESEVSASVGVKARVVYGEELKEGKMEEFLGKRVDGPRGWAEAVGELEGRLKARGRKGKEGQE